jgi:hypothetical protein
MARLALARFKLQNNRRGALIAVFGLTLLGFLLGIAILVLAPLARSGHGIFAFLYRPGSPVLDARRLGSQPALGARSRDARPELWRTPVALLAFPNDAAFTEVARTSGAARVVYTPTSDRRILPMPAIQDALGRSLLFVVVTVGAEDDTRTPGPYRPDPTEATRLTVLASSQDPTDPAGCILTLGPSSELKATGTLGGVDLSHCQAGRIPVSDQEAVAFRVRYDLLPNYRGRDGAWRTGGVLGRTEVVASTAARDAAPG